MFLLIISICEPVSIRHLTCTLPLMYANNVNNCNEMFGLVICDFIGVLLLLNLRLCRLNVCVSVDSFVVTVLLYVVVFSTSIWFETTMELWRCRFCSVSFMLCILFKSSVYCGVCGGVL